MQPFPAQYHSVEIGTANRHFVRGVEGIVVKIGTQRRELQFYPIIRAQTIYNLAHQG
jgi:hypothetical protein